MVERRLCKAEATGSSPVGSTTHMRIIFGFLGIIIGIIILRKTYQLAEMFGQIEFAEKYLGSGGTYTFYKIVGLVLIVSGATYMFGILDIFFSPFTSFFGAFGKNK